MTTKTLTLLLSIGTLSATAAINASAENNTDGGEGNGPGMEVVSGREARARAKAQGTVFRDKVEIYTKPEGEKFTGSEVIEILQDAGEEYGVIWQDGSKPAGEAAADKLAEMLGTTREELGDVAREVSRAAEEVAGDVSYAVDATKNSGEVQAMVKDLSKAAVETADDIQYAVEATKNSGEVRAMVKDLNQAAVETAGDIKYAVDYAKDNGGVVGAVASVLGVTADELKDVIQVFGKEAKSIYKDLASLPEWGELGSSVTGAAGGVGQFWVSEGGELVAAVSGDDTKVVIGQAPKGSVDKVRYKRGKGSEAVGNEHNSMSPPATSTGSSSQGGEGATEQIQESTTVVAEEVEQL